MKENSYFTPYILSVVVLSCMLDVTICQKSTGEPPTTQSMNNSTTATSTSPSPNTLTSTVSTNATDTPFVTIGPSKEVKYSLNLTNSGPAVLDSTLVFNAVLIPQNNASLDPWPVKFIFQWMNMATMQMDKTEGGLTSQLIKTFPSVNVKEGDYTMTVAAFLKRDPAKIVAFQTKKFILTEKLNGHLILKQHLDYQRAPNIFSTKKNVSIIADVHDQFQKKKQPDFEFFWYEGKHFLSDTVYPNYTCSFEEPANFTMKSVIVASFMFDTDLNGNYLSADQDGMKNQQNSQSSSEVSTSIKQNNFRRSQRDPLPYLKNGDFEQAVMFLDPLENCYVVRVDKDPEDRGIELGQPAVINITCIGSAPSSVCWNISSSNASWSFSANETCKPVNFTNTVQHQVKIKLNSTGWSDIHYFIYNDISRIHLNESYYGYNTEDVNVPALILPIVFGVIGVCIVLAGVAYIMRLRKKPMVEVADFDFHPSLTSNNESETSVRFSRVVNTIKLMFFRNRYESSHTDPNECKSSSALRIQDTDVKQFYGSL